jgi:hypothetical protein
MTAVLLSPSIAAALIPEKYLVVLPLCLKGIEK